MTKSKQVLLFSATISDEVKDFALSGIKEYRMLKVDKDSQLSDLLKMHFFITRSNDKLAGLLYLLNEQVKNDEGKKEQSIIFGATRHHVEYYH